MVLYRNYVCLLGLPLLPEARGQCGIGGVVKAPGFTAGNVVGCTLVIDSLFGVFVPCVCVIEVKGVQSCYQGSAKRDPVKGKL